MSLFNRPGVLALGFAFWWAGLLPAHADGVRDCVQNAKAKLKVSACTQVLQKNRFPDKKRIALTYLHRSLGHLKLEDFTRALGDADKAVAVAPKFAMTHFGRGQALRHLKRYDAAIAAYDEAARLDAKVALIFRMRAKIYRTMKNYDKAVADYELALALEPGNVFITVPLKWARDKLKQHPSAPVSGPAK